MQRNYLISIIFIITCSYAKGQNIVYAENTRRLMEYFDSVHIEMNYVNYKTLGRKQLKVVKRAIEERMDFWDKSTDTREKDMIFNTDSLFIIYHSNYNKCVYSHLYKQFITLAYYQSRKNIFEYAPYDTDELDELVLSWDKVLFNRIRDKSIERPRDHRGETDIDAYLIVRRDEHLFEYEHEYFTEDFQLDMRDWSIVSYINKYLTPKGH